MSKHISDNTKEGVVYGSISDMTEDNTPVSTQIHNHIAHQGVSRRRKIRITDDDQQNRKLKIKQRLLDKLKARKAKKSS
ncbi:MAG TPA: hypothetical protein EYO60_07765 [Candidatus Lambdaproteobacteria bacterium]|nr:hypothetical protein [Candidatus Lambdaproteobacteria bacterium]